jgi:sigma-B regulation protein RsbU (phosphoserine phosphatase)
VQYSATEARLRPGESLPLCSDGLSEARNPAGAEYGAQCVSAAIRVCGGGTAEAISGALVAELDRFVAGGPRTDDITIMVIRRTNG